MEAIKSYEEIIDFFAAGTTPEALVAFHPSDSVQQRVAALVESSKEGSISSEAQSELDGLNGFGLLDLEHLDRTAHLRSYRRAASRASLRNGTPRRLPG